MGNILVASLVLIRLHGPAGHEIDINPHGVSSFRETYKGSMYYDEKVRCLVIMDNGKFIGVKESCAVVREMLLHPHGVVR